MITGNFDWKMNEDQQFSFDIRKELERLCDAEETTDLYHISHLVPYYAKKQKKLNKNDVFQALLDMITYSSRGNMERAVRNLRLSNQFLRRCTGFLTMMFIEGMELSVQLLFEIWKVHFIATKYYLECGVLEQEVSSSLIESCINDMNLNALMWTQFDHNRKEWCKTTINLFQMLSESLNKKMLDTKLNQA